MRRWCSGVLFDFLRAGKTVVQDDDVDHNHEVLAEVLSPDEITALYEARIAAERVSGL